MVSIEKCTYLYNFYQEQENWLAFTQKNILTHLLAIKKFLLWLRKGRNTYKLKNWKKITWIINIKQNFILSACNLNSKHQYSFPGSLLISVIILKIIVFQKSSMIKSLIIKCISRKNNNEIKSWQKHKKSGKKSSWWAIFYVYLSCKMKSGKTVYKMCQIYNMVQK